MASGQRDKREKDLTRDFLGRMLVTSRLCHSAHPPLRTQCMRSAFLIVAHRARSSAPPKLATGSTHVRSSWAPVHRDREHHALFATGRRYGQASQRAAFPEAPVRPCLGRKRRFVDGRYPRRPSPRGARAPRGSMSAQGHIRAPRTSARRQHVGALERDIPTHANCAQVSAV